MMILRLCDSCRFYDSDAGTCQAFPDGVMLPSDEPHFDTVAGQKGNKTYELDNDKYDLLDMFLRVHPDVKLPVRVNYDVPDVEGMEDADTIDSPRMD